MWCPRHHPHMITTEVMVAASRMVVVWVVFKARTLGLFKDNH